MEDNVFSSATLQAIEHDKLNGKPP